MALLKALIVGLNGEPRNVGSDKIDPADFGIMTGTFASIVPTVVPTSGALGTGNTFALRYFLTPMRTCKFQLDLLFGASGNGTGSGQLSVTMPIAAFGYNVFNGEEVAVGATNLKARLGSGTTLTIITTAFGYPAVNSGRIIFNGEYETV